MTSSFGFITSTAKSVLEKLFPDSVARRRRIQSLVTEVEDMEKTVSVMEFSAYFNRLVEVKELLLEELVAVYTTLRKQDVEVERLNVVVDEKNKAIFMLATENESEKEEFNSAQNELKALREKVAALETKEKRYEALLKRLNKSDSAKEEDIGVEGNVSIVAKSM